MDACFVPNHNTLTGYDFREDAPLSKTRAIREFCLACQGGSKDRVKTCHLTDCHLWPYRLGRGICQSEDGERTSPARKMSEENKAKAAERMRNMREKK